MEELKTLNLDPNMFKACFEHVKEEKFYCPKFKKRATVVQKKMGEWTIDVQINCCRETQKEGYAAFLIRVENGILKVSVTEKAKEKSLCYEH